ncbi:hypothetical protein thsps117_40330 [Pseudomonas sp. No.117]
MIFTDRVERREFRDAGVEGEDVYSSYFLVHRLEESGEGCYIGCIDASLPEPTGANRNVARLGTPTGRIDGSAFHGEALGDGAANATISADDNRDFS